MDIFDNNGAKIVAGTETYTAVAEEKAVGETGEPKLTVGYILAQMEKVRADSAHIFSALESAKQIETRAPGPGAPDIAGQAKAQAIVDIVKCRETTNQMLLEMYTKMYDGLTGAKPAEPPKFAQATGVLDMIRQLPQGMTENDEFVEIIGAAIGDMLRNISK